ncbi:MAG: terpene cyclase/mutase family protein [Planctomycetota bacterium]|nr:terpene cyclase/mutase family protein [Planctomycetota bacterium]
MRGRQEFSMGMSGKTAPGITLVILALVGVVGYFQYQRHQARNEELAIAALTRSFVIPFYGSPASPEASMSRGLAFLAKNQNEDGSFGGMPPGAKEGDVGITALAILAWATSPEATRKDVEGPFSKGIEFILSHQQKDGSIINVGQGLNTYKTATAILALRSVDPDKHGGAIRKARDYLVGLQLHEGNGNVDKKNPHYGAWGYKEGKPNGNLSTTHFALEALKEAGLSESDPAWQRAIVFLQRCQNRSESNDYTVGVSVGDDGGFRYDPGLRKEMGLPTESKDGAMRFPSYASMTYAGLKSLLNANLSKDDPRVKAAVGWILKHYTLEDNYGLGTRDDPKRAKQGLYYYYLAFARALDAYGEGVLRGEDGSEHRWAEDLSEKLISLQREDGSWVNEEDRWWESDPGLVTSYAVSALAIAARNIQ